MPSILSLTFCMLSQIRDKRHMRKGAEIHARTHDKHAHTHDTHAHTHAQSHEPLTKKDKGVYVVSSFFWRK